MYAFVGKTTTDALVILRVEDPEKAVKSLTNKNIKVLSSETVYKL